MSKHTPGPWNLFNTAEIFTNLGAVNAEGIEATSNDGWMIADCDMGGLSLSEIKANAMLIAAAPDLLEALEVMIEFVANVHANKAQTICYSEMDKARAAIAKAKGETK